MIGVCGDWKTNSRIVSVWKAPVHSDRSSVVNWIRPEPSGRPSSAATAKRDSQATRGILWVLEKAESIKFPTAPESIKAVVSITSPLTLKVTGISRTEDIVEVYSPMEGYEVAEWDTRLSGVQGDHSTNTGCCASFSLSPPCWGEWSLIAWVQVQVEMSCRPKPQGNGLSSWANEVIYLNSQVDELV